MNYLGEFPMIINKTPVEWGLHYVTAYGGVDGEHHKAWVLDQVFRILTGTPVITTVAKWGADITQIEYEEIRFSTGEPSEEYFRLVAEAKDGEDGPETYSWEEGIPP
jgi:hypothetical protein